MRIRTLLAMTLVVTALVGAATGEPERPAAPTPTDLSIDPELLVQGFFHGQCRVTASATVPPGSRAVFRLIGPEEDVRLHLLGRVGGVLWANRGDRTLARVPTVMLIHGWPRAPAEEDLLRHGLGLRALADRVLPASPDSEDRRVFRELMALESQEGRFTLTGSGRVAPDGRALVEFVLPRDTPPGDLEVTVHVITDDRVTAEASRRLVLRRREAVMAVETLAGDRDILYAVLAVLLAIGTGICSGLVLGLGSRVS